MMKRVLMSLFVAAVAVLIVMPASAQKTFTVQRLGDVNVIPTQPVNRQACQVGNLEAPAWAVQDWLVGNEEYKYLVIPAEQCQACADFPGFRLLAVHILLQFSDLQVPQTFTVAADLEDAAYDTLTGCWWPGVEDCISYPVTITIDQPGVYDIAVPIDCDCAHFFNGAGMPYIYLISLHFLDAINADLILDATPTPCVAFNDWGQGWVDLFQYFGQYGDLIMWADVDCCDQPVSDEATSWGLLKSLYR